MLAQKKDKAMITGQGRWGLYVKRPSAMIEYDRQAALEEKLATALEIEAGGELRRRADAAYRAGSSTPTDLY